MLLRHVLSYFVSRGLPGLINFASIAVYTRLLEPEQYGRYNLTVATTSFLNVVLFEWLRVALLRFWPVYREDPRAFLSTIRTSFIALGTLVSLLAVAATIIDTRSDWRGLILLGVLLTWAQGWFDLNLEFARSKLLPRRYGIMVALRAILSLGFGTAAAMYGLGAAGPITGLVLGTALTTTLLSMPEWRSTRFGVRKEILFELFRYGVPLSVTLALTFVVSVSDRFIIAKYLGDDVAGVYAASYDFVNQILSMLMMVIGLAFGPVLVRIFEEKGASAVRDVVEQNGRLLLLVAMQVTVVFAVAGLELADIFLGPGFGDSTRAIIPLIALSAFLAGLRMYHYDQAFRLGRSTMIQLVVTIPVVVINVVVNMAFVPVVGMEGAAIAAVVAYGIAIVLSVVLGRRLVRITLPLQDAGLIAAAAFLMGGVLKNSYHLGQNVPLLVKIGVAALSYLLVLSVTGVVRRVFRGEFAVDRGIGHIDAK